MSPLAQLHIITNRLLSADSNALGELLAIESELYELLTRTAGMNEDSEVARKHLVLESGKAIGTVWAAMCVKDILRTKKFIDGIYMAVMDLRKLSNRKPIHILYTGTGPFATLILPLFSRFSREEIQLTLIEVNEYSFQSLERIIKKFELEGYIRNIQHADAVQWDLPAGERIDLFICEAIQQALTKEPQVSIYMNIVPQLPSHTVLIPERIVLHASLVNPVLQMRQKIGEGPDENYEILLDTIFELSRDTVMENAEVFRKSQRTFRFPSKNISIPEEYISSHPLLHISTTIHIYKKMVLERDECVLTIPLLIKDLKKDHLNGSLNFHYQTGKEPGIIINLQTQAEAHRQ